jgi:adenylate cyclase
MNDSVNLNALRGCLEGVIPSVIATVASDGTPNVTLVSQVYYVDERHVALSFQFFNKTRENILVNPYAMVQVIDPDSGAHFRLAVRYLRTETQGALFEKMKAMLAGIASHTGMAKVFRLLGADIYEVQSIQALCAGRPPCALPGYDRLTALRASLQQLAGAADLDALLDGALLCLQRHFGMPQAMLLMYDSRGERLYTVASRGYAVSGIGAEIPLGAGVIGVAAQARTPIRIQYLTGQYSYNLAVRDSLQQDNPALALETEIPFAGLAEPHSQLAVPLVRHGELAGVLYADSDQDLRFTHEDEDALGALADYLALAIAQWTESSEHPAQHTGAAQTRAPARGKASVIRHYAANDSIFIDEAYLIKGVAGAICWKLLQDYTTQQRREFSNRELRLDPSIGLPEIGDNLEARLILLQKRLVERCDFLRLVRTGRGRFQLQVDRSVSLERA